MEMVVYGYGPWTWESLLFSRGLLFLFAFFISPFPHRFGLFPPCCVFLILAFYSHTIVSPSYLATLVLHLFLTLFFLILNLLFSSFLFNLNWARSRGKNIMLLGSLIHELACQITFFVTYFSFFFVFLPFLYLGSPILYPQLPHHVVYLTILLLF
jgi:hypothetical protein